MHYPCMFIAVYVRNTCTYNVLNISSDSCVCSPCFCWIIYQSWQFMSTIYLPFRIISIISCFPLVCAILSSIYLLSSSSFNFSETAISLILHHNFTIEILLLKINLLPNLIFWKHHSVRYNYPFFFYIIFSMDNSNNFTCKLAYWFIYT